MLRTASHWRADRLLLVGIALLATPTHAELIGAAHRGGRFTHPENTIVNFLYGADRVEWLETDSWLSSDGVPVLHHDVDMCRTTDIENFGYDCVDSLNNPMGRFPWIQDFDLNFLKQLDVGEWFAPEFIGTQMPTLEEALLALDGTGAPLLVEVKTANQATTIQNIIDNNSLPTDSIIIWARAGESLAQEFRNNAPNLRRVHGIHDWTDVDDTLLAGIAANGDFGIGIFTKSSDVPPLEMPQSVVDLVHSYELVFYSLPTGAGEISQIVQIDYGVDVLNVFDTDWWEGFRAALPCVDGEDNDGDGRVDFDGLDADFNWVLEKPADPGCADRLDIDEQNALFPCDDGVDNDGDGLIDMADPQCVAPDDLSGELLSVPALGPWGSLLLVAALAQIGALLARTRARDRRS